MRLRILFRLTYNHGYLVCRGHRHVLLYFFYSKALVEAAKEEVLQTYPGWMKKYWVNSIRSAYISPRYEDRNNKECVDGPYSPHGHDCMPNDRICKLTWRYPLRFRKWQKKPNETPTIVNMWRNDVNHIWSTRPMSKIHKLINRQPKIMQPIINCDEIMRCIEITVSWNSRLTFELCMLQIPGQFQALFLAPKRPTTEIWIFWKGKQNRRLMHNLFDSDLNDIILFPNTFYGVWLFSEKYWDKKLIIEDFIQK